MDKIGANFEFSVGTIRDRLGANPVPIQLPIGAEKDFVGFVDLIRMKYVEFIDDAKDGGRSYMEGDIPDDHPEVVGAHVRPAASLPPLLLEERLLRLER